MHSGNGFGHPARPLARCRRRPMRLVLPLRIASVRSEPGSQRIGRRQKVLFLAAGVRHSFAFADSEVQALPTVERKGRLHEKVIRSRPRVTAYSYLMELAGRILVIRKEGPTSIRTEAASVPALMRDRK